MTFWRFKYGVLPVVKTTRSLRGVNKAIRKGFNVIIKSVEPSDKLKTKYCVVKDKRTGKIKTLFDFREKYESNYEVIIDWTFYYPYHFYSPFAAYVLPKDLKIGQRVFVEDLIEDLIGSKWNQGDTYRLKSCEAIWNGETLELQHDENSELLDIIG